MQSSNLTPTARHTWATFILSGLVCIDAKIHLLGKPMVCQEMSIVVIYRYGKKIKNRFDYAGIGYA